MYVGVIAVLITLGIIVQLTFTSTELKEEQTLKDSIVKMKEQCNFVCSLNEGTSLSTEVELFSGHKYYSNEKSICYSDDSNKNVNCERCNCTLQPYSLDLSIPEAMQAFKSHEYDCYFEKTEEGISMGCKGR